MRKNGLMAIFSLFIISALSTITLAAHMPIKNNVVEGKGRGSVPDTRIRVHDVGLLWLTMTNYGSFGNDSTNPEKDPCTGLTAPNADFPGGSTNHYLFQGSIWVGGYLDRGNGTFVGPKVSTANDGWSSIQEIYPSEYEEGHGSVAEIVETSNLDGKTNCFGEEIYDPKASAEQQFTAIFTDKLTDPAYVNNDPASPDSAHYPLGIEIRQDSYAWSYDYAQDFILIDYTIYNRNKNHKDIVNMFMGLYMDCDVGRVTNASANYHEDDISGFKKIYNFIDEGTGSWDSTAINLAWIADNDGRNYKGSGKDKKEPEKGTVLNGALGITGMKVVRSPNPNLKLSFNWWNSNSDETKDWGPRWKNPNDPGYNENFSHHGGSTNWTDLYDLTFAQKGYHDYEDFGNHPNGMTEGTPMTDIGKYMVMSNGEFDYDQTDVINDTHAGSQKNYWADFDVFTGSADVKKDVSNGYDTRYFLSFGPLGNENSSVVKTVDGDVTKSIWSLGYGDSIKLTVAYVAGEDFHTSIEQDPEEPDPSLFSFRDVALNSIWASKVYDNPLYDTPVTINGVTKGDGWYGEDVGEDGIFAEGAGFECWWNNQIYPSNDKGENDGHLTTFTAPVTDIYGNTATNEDELLPKGNESIENDDIGVTSKFGYMVPDPQNPSISYRYGYNNGILDRGDGIPNFKGPPPPPSPIIKISYNDNDVVVEWQSDNYGINSPETFEDPFSHRLDFEGYQVWFSKTAIVSDFVKIFSVDKVDYIYKSLTLQNKYLDIPMPADSIENNPSHYPAYLDSDNGWWNLVSFGDNNDIYLPHSSVGADNWRYEATFDDSIWKYKFILKDKMAGIVNYIAVTSSDFGDPKAPTSPLTSSPSQNMTTIVPSKLSSTTDPIVVPNPYRVDIDYQELNWESAKSGSWSEHDRRISFLNIPEKCVIRIYTLAGDLVKTISHNGLSKKANGFMNGASWDLINDNAQTVTSGLYLFSVQDINDKSNPYVGKFVIIK